MKNGLLLPFFLIPFFVYSQYAPPVGQEGSTAIASDSSVFIAWAEECTLHQSWKNIADTLLGRVTFGEEDRVYGIADNSPVSLGDGGYVIAHFDPPIINGEDYDFAVFENSFSDEFLELAFVEVSSDGENFFRFPAVSNTQIETQIETFGVLDATQIHNLAGKYRTLYGTPFDLEEMKEMEGLDVMHITDIKVLDVIGSIDEAYASLDAQNNIINDPYPTAFDGGGFDLDAIGVIHDEAHNGVIKQDNLALKLYPNPASTMLFIEDIPSWVKQIRIFSIEGIERYYFKLQQEKVLSFPLDLWDKGVYFVQFIGKQMKVKRIMKI